MMQGRDCDRVRNGGPWQGNSRDRERKTLRMAIGMRQGSSDDRVSGREWRAQ